MEEAPKHPRETERLEALEELNILDTAPEENFDEIVRLTSAICRVPTALITFIDDHRQWFKAKVGMEGEETSRREAFCSHCILKNEVMVVEDATKDARFQDNPLVRGAPGIRFYAGAPIALSPELPMGSLCIIDYEPREPAEEEIEALQVLANRVSRELELRLANRQLREAKNAAEGYNRQLTQLIRVISHDLRNPFNGLVGMTELLQLEYRQMSEDEIDDAVRVLNDSTHQAFALLENLLEWSRMEADLFGFQPEPVYLVKLVDQAIQLLSPEVEKKSIQLVREIPEDLLVRVDSRMIASVIRNLISNAIKFTRPGKKVRVSATPVNEHAEVAIADDGVGMEPARIEAVLSGKSLDSTHGTKGEKGTGVGLSLIRGFLEIHKTSLSLKSAPDEGTRASFRLPRA